LKYPAEPLALLRGDRLDVLGPAPGLVEDEGDGADRPRALLQASVPLEELLPRPVVVRDARPGVVVTSVVCHLIGIIVVPIRVSDAK
jgi:hypothetical protein